MVRRRRSRGTVRGRGLIRDLGGRRGIWERQVQQDTRFVGDGDYRQSCTQIHVVRRFKESAEDFTAMVCRYLKNGNEHSIPAGSGLEQRCDKDHITNDRQVQATEVGNYGSSFLCQLVPV